MSGSPKKRKKSYRPKHVRIPVTSLREEFSLVLHMALEMARTGHFSKLQYDRIGQAINCIWGALFIRPPKDPSVTLVIEGAMRAMNDAGRRGESSGVWELRDLEQAALLAGIHKAEETLPKMDVMVIYQSMQKMKELQYMELVDAKAAFMGIDLAGNDDRTTIVTAVKDEAMKIVGITEIKTINIIDEKSGEVIRIERKAA
jgi:hypothetical protein